MSHELLRLGVDGLANTHEVFPKMWFRAHHGAAVLAAHFIREEFDLPVPVADAVAAFAKRIIDSAPEVFVSNPTDTEIVEIEPIAMELDRNIASLTADGHDVIFASLAIKAFREEPSLATAARVAGIVELIKDGQFDNPKRYYGYDDYLNDPVDYSEVPRFANLDEAVVHALSDHGTVYPDQTLDGQHYFLAGNKLHDVTHAHALVELERMGYHSMVAKGLEALRKQFHLCDSRRVPKGLVAFSIDEQFDPWSLPFWQRDKVNDHHIKLAYSMMSLLRGIDKRQHDAILKDVSKYWALLP